MKIGTQALDAYQRTMGTAPTAAVRPAATQAAQAPQNPTSDEAATVQFSDAAKALAQQASASYDPQKVASLKSQVQDGSYKVDAHLVASRIVDQIA